MAPLLAMPVIERRAPIPVGAVFEYRGRLLKVVRVYGVEPRSPVIVEELMSFGPVVLAGQYGLWSADAVSLAMSGRLR